MCKCAYIVDALRLHEALNFTAQFLVACAWCYEMTILTCAMRHSFVLKLVALHAKILALIDKQLLICFPQLLV
jgi:hypothetical protein